MTGRGWGSPRSASDDALLGAARRCRVGGDRRSLRLARADGCGASTPTPPKVAGRRPTSRASVCAAPTCTSTKACSPRPTRSSGRSAPRPTASPSPSGASPDCARLHIERSRIRFDRAGGDRVLEAYPAAALLLWGLPREGYKTDPAAREDLLDALESAAPWLVWGRAPARPASNRTTPSTPSSAR